jgi:hypothetical protein
VTSKLLWFQTRPFGGKKGPIDIVREEHNNDMQQNVVKAQNRLQCVKEHETIKELTRKKRTNSVMKKHQNRDVQQNRVETQSRRTNFMEKQEDRNLQDSEVQVRYESTNFREEQQNSDTQYSEDQASSKHSRVSDKIEKQIQPRRGRRKIREEPRNHDIQGMEIHIQNEWTRQDTEDIEVQYLNKCTNFDAVHRNNENYNMHGGKDQAQSESTNFDEEQQNHDTQDSELETRSEWNKFDEALRNHDTQNSGASVQSEWAKQDTLDKVGTGMEGTRKDTQGSGVKARYKHTNSNVATEKEVQSERGRTNVCAKQRNHNTQFRQASRKYTKFDEKSSECTKFGEAQRNHDAQENEDPVQIGGTRQDTQDIDILQRNEHTNFDGEQQNGDTQDRAVGARSECAKFGEAQRNHDAQENEDPVQIGGTRQDTQDIDILQRNEHTNFDGEQQNGDTQDRAVGARSECTKFGEAQRNHDAQENEDPVQIGGTRQDTQDIDILQRNEHTNFDGEQQNGDTQDRAIGARSESGHEANVPSSARRSEITTHRKTKIQFRLEGQDKIRRTSTFCSEMSTPISMESSRTVTHRTEQSGHEANVPSSARRNEITTHRKTKIQFRLEGQDKIRRTSTFYSEMSTPISMESSRTVTHRTEQSGHEANVPSSARRNEITTHRKTKIQFRLEGQDKIRRTSTFYSEMSTPISMESSKTVTHRTEQSGHEANVPSSARRSEITTHRKTKIQFRLQGQDKIRRTSTFYSEMSTPISMESSRTVTHRTEQSGHEANVPSSARRNEITTHRKTKIQFRLEGQDKIRRTSTFYSERSVPISMEGSDTMTHCIIIWCLIEERQDKS